MEVPVCHQIARCVTPVPTDDIWVYIYIGCGYLPVARNKKKQQVVNKVLYVCYKRANGSVGIVFYSKLQDTDSLNLPLSRSELRHCCLFLGTVGKIKYCYLSVPQKHLSPIIMLCEVKWIL